MHVTVPLVLIDSGLAETFVKDLRVSSVAISIKDSSNSNIVKTPKHIDSQEKNMGISLYTVPHPHKTLPSRRYTGATMFPVPPERTNWQCGCNKV